jgi:hypothetical protein
MARAPLSFSTLKALFVAGNVCANIVVTAQSSINIKEVNFFIVFGNY